MINKAIGVSLCSLYLLCFHLTAWSQEATKSSISVTIQDTLIHTHCLLSSPTISFHTEKTYYSYYKDSILTTQGESLGALLHGSYKAISPGNVLIESGAFEQGLKNGEWKNWYKDGQLKSQTEWKEGKQHGAALYFDTTGNIVARGKYRNGLKKGTWLIKEGEGKMAKKKFKNGVAQLKKPAKQNRQDSNSRGKDKTSTPQTAPAPKVQKEKNKPVLSDGIATSNNRSFKQIFVRDAKSKAAIKNASVKVNQFSVHTQREAYRRFIETDENGFLSLPTDTSDYVLYISKSGYYVQKFRIYESDVREAITIEMEPEKTCKEVVFVFENGFKSYPVNQAEVIAEKNNRVIDRTFTRPDGSAAFCLPCGGTYTISVHKKAYRNKTTLYTLDDNCEGLAEVNVLLSPDEELNESTPPIALSPSAPINNATNVKQEEYSLPGLNEKFLLIAGSFSKKENAEKRLEEMKEQGFKDAQIIHFIETGYFSVCINTFRSKGHAEQFQRSVNVKTYIKSI